MNVVATRETRIALDRMLALADERGGGEAVRLMLPKMDPAQLPALLALLLRPAHENRGTRGRPQVPFTLSVEARRRGYSQYRQGIRNDFTITAMREYTRANKRAERRDQEAS